jgi:glyoxylase-like metal-dependent hydrolase (beta-lactamase superfamily II)
MHHDGHIGFQIRTREKLALVMMMFVSDLLQVGGFLWVLRFPPPIKLTTMILLKYCDSGIKHHKPNQTTL